MPCHYYTPEEERDQAQKRYREELDRLTHENDVLREALLVASEGGEIDDKFLHSVRNNQIKHRREDLKRLEAEIIEIIKSGEPFDEDLYRTLGLVIAADPTKPLKQQLGFDPDSF